MTTESNNDAEIERLKQLLGEAIRQPAWVEEARNVGSTGDNKSLVNFHLEPHALYQLRLLALNKGQPVQEMLCDALNKIFIENNLPPIAK